MVNKKDTFYIQQLDYHPIWWWRLELKRYFTANLLDSHIETSPQKIDGAMFLQNGVARMNPQKYEEMFV